MGNTPEQNLEDMADAIVRTLTALRNAARHLPIPVTLPKPKPGMPAKDLIGPIKALRAKLEKEPISEAVLNRLDQAALGVLAAIDLTRVAMSEEIDYRYDAIHMIGTISIIAARLAENELKGAAN
ncbi:hypothetical protein [Nonomuraea angiospora]|uniref:hypothetical protein n=1 Tax=Nonomuraea angiospora TaxID=46172 RepID=UPI0029A73B09|nr:hypothetical protein [Nonomuraea angiospora]MDX3100465.1 hypothetical protein [Nonomuraea angiospora]